jgi:hypothetical protein
VAPSAGQAPLRAFDAQAPPQAFQGRSSRTTVRKPRARGLCKCPEKGSINGQASPAASGPVGPCLLRADREHICVPGHIALEIDLVAHEAALHSALAMEPGDVRDVALCAALLQDGVLLEDEPYSDWALEPRVALERLRQRARMELARNRTQGYGRSRLEGVIDAWENCLAHDPASEEAAVTLMRAYAGLGQRQLVARTYHRCRRGLEEVGLKASVATERAYHDAMTDAAEFTAPWSYEIFAAARNAISSNPVTSMKKPALEDISLGLLTHS